MDRKSEIVAVKVLGERIGYGNIMDIASALWTMRLSDDGVERIALVPAGQFEMENKELERKRKQVLSRIEEIKSYNILKRDDTEKRRGIHG